MRRSKDRKIFLAVVVATISALTHAFTTRIHSKHEFQIFQPRLASLKDDLGHVNGVSSPADGPKSSQFEQGYLSPFHLLYPESFPTSSIPFRQSTPLYTCLQLMRTAIKKAVLQNGNGDPLKSQGRKVYRIEHKISHKVDPLCWLQAQRRLNDHTQQPSMYFESAEGNIEAAAFGSSITFKGTADEELFWEIIQSLPQSSYMYGGQRFDTGSSIGEEWQSFSKGFWMLPAVEVRNQKSNSGESNSTLAVHLIADDEGNVLSSARRILDILASLTDESSDMTSPTTLPPVLSRISTYGTNLDGQEIYERGVLAALDEFKKPESDLEKVVLARRMDLSFARHAFENVDALDVLRKWKFALQPGGHIFFLHPGGIDSGEFFGCTPERLFQVNGNRVMSEALAGTRPRGATPEADATLSRELFQSGKDQEENRITGKFIQNTFESLEDQGLLNVVLLAGTNETNMSEGSFFVRRLRHLQHLCQRYDRIIPDGVAIMGVIRNLLVGLHPTPAVGGFPKRRAIEFIREYESSGFDRGFYSGPFGYIGRDSADIIVAIRSGLWTKNGERPKLSVYAGAGIVPGSTVQGEWAETSYKLAVVSSIFPQSPVTLQQASTPNVAWATAFIEELIRNGITQFYVCPGSRSTPLVAAIARAVRSHVGVVRASSIHDERGAGFRAVGYARGSGRPAAIVTSSGTAVANLYPAVVEAGVDGLPLLVLTADRPYENRNTGANQAIDQVKIFSDSYLRWFRDILPPSDDVPVSVALADATHAVSLSKKLRGPVHLNIQFRENLTPDAGPIRNDDRARALTNYDAFKFTDSPSFHKWSLGGSRWLNVYAQELNARRSAVSDIGNLIAKSRRGIIVVGNLRKAESEAGAADISETIELVSSFAKSIGFPIFASALSGTLRFQSPNVVLFAEHILRSPIVQEGLQPDLILQFGAPLISTEIPKIIKAAIRDAPAHHVLVHPHQTDERADPDFTVSHNIDNDIGLFLRALSSFVDKIPAETLGSELLHLIGIGKRLQKIMPDFVNTAAVNVRDASNAGAMLSEPEVVLALAQASTDPQTPEMSLFLSNSMPIRDAEAFLYPLSTQDNGGSKSLRLRDTAVNRGASGIDGIISSASGFADATRRPTTLLIGDVAALHDLNSFHSLKASTNFRDSEFQRDHPLVTIVLNNDGGGIFSFLPIAGHGAEVGFEEFFGTPTHSFSFATGAAAFGLPFEKAPDVQAFKKSYSTVLQSGVSSVIEAVVAPREENVLIHKEITRMANSFVESLLQHECDLLHVSKSLPVKFFSHRRDEEDSKTLVLLHGWMGDKSEWDEASTILAERLQDWNVIAIDLPGHGDSNLQFPTPFQYFSRALKRRDETRDDVDFDLGVDAMAAAIHKTLFEIGIKRIDAVAGYSLGGRVALAMKRNSLVSVDNCKLILLSAFPGEISQNSDHVGNNQRRAKDDDIAERIRGLVDRSVYLQPKDDSAILFSEFLDSWYGALIWGDLKKDPRYESVFLKRSQSLQRRGYDLAAVLQQCSPARCRSDDWRGVDQRNTLYISGSLDKKYSAIGDHWQNITPDLHVDTIAKKGHALLVEAPVQVADKIVDFVTREISRKIGNETRALLFKKSTNEDMSLHMSASDTRSGQTSANTVTVASLDFQKFIIDFANDRTKKPGIAGIGWGERAEAKNVAKQRTGFIIQVMSIDGANTGIGEVSPLPGLHAETLEDVEQQLNDIAQAMSTSNAENVFSVDAREILSFSGGMKGNLDRLSQHANVAPLYSSVRSGLEMTLLSLASQVLSQPIQIALTNVAAPDLLISKANSLVSLNGLITRGSARAQIVMDQMSGISSSAQTFESWKVKVGHQSAYEDAMAISYAFQMAQSQTSASGGGKIRADANRGFNVSAAISFANLLKGIDNEAFSRLEYVEEPLQRAACDTSINSFQDQVKALEEWSKSMGIAYALDESISDLAERHNYNFNPMAAELRAALLSTEKGCVALILKPALLGLELSFRLAKLARQELGIGAVFTSSFDSGVGLAFAAFLANLSDSSKALEGVKQYAHGLGTYNMLADDCISPAFGSYVNRDGMLNVASLSRAFYGLGLDEIRCLADNPLPSPEAINQISTGKSNQTEDDAFERHNLELPDEFEASTATSSDGREIRVVASLPLPFSAEIACSRFTDLPQQPRWSPWISSVAYVDARSETEWTLRIRGVNFRWRAKSSIFTEPYRGIRWKSTSGLRNTGVVEFIPTDDKTCIMKVEIIFVTPRILSPLFRGTSVFFEDFLRNKVLKWSLEMFRDVVKGDLALEEGNIELGDALFSSVEGKASAIEATLSSRLVNNNE